MKCEYCGVEIHPGTEVTFEGHNFCNSLHMQWWSSHGLRAAANSSAVPAATPKKAGRKAQLIGLITTALFVAIGSYIGSHIGSGLFASGDAVDSQLIKISNELNKRCPMMVDAETRLDNTVAIPGRTFAYNYTVIGLARDHIDTTQLELALKPRMINTVKTSPSMKYFRDNEVTLDYNYSDEAGVYMMGIRITPADYR